MDLWTFGCKYLLASPRFNNSEEERLTAGGPCISGLELKVTLNEALGDRALRLHPSSLKGVNVKLRIQSIIVWAVVLACACTGPAVAQLITGSLTGLVTDSSGAAAPSVTVTAKNADTGIAAETRSSATGNFVIANLQPGTYSLEASASGFKTWVRPGIVVFAGDNLRIDAVLQVGGQQDRIEVTAEAPVLKTESTEVSSTMERKLVNDMPLTIGSGTRTVFNLQMMMPQSVSTNGESGGDDMRMGGGQHNNFNVSVDGLTVEMGWRNAQSYMRHSTPSIEAIEEFNIQTRPLRRRTAGSAAD
jgi:hypothetical protein